MRCKECGVNKPKSYFRKGRLSCYRCVYLKSRKRMNVYRRKRYNTIPSVRSKEQERNRLNQKRRREKGLEKQYRQSSVRRWLCGRTRTCKVGAKRKDKSYQINLDFLCSLYKKQGGKCAISNLQMDTKFKSPYAISIDRTDSEKGYVVGNVQLVCQAINLAKNKHSNAIMIEFTNSIRKTKRKKT